MTLAIQGLGFDFPMQGHSSQPKYASKPFGEISDFVKQLTVDFSNYFVEKNKAQSNWVSTSTKDTAIVINGRFVSSNKVPDVRGLGLRDALFILENAGLKVKTYGRGKVKKQSLPVGRSYKKGERIVIQLS